MNIMEIISLIMLIAGIALTVITMLQMRSGKLNLPTLGKILLSVAMIFMLVITLLGILPVEAVTDLFVTEHTDAVTEISIEIVDPSR